jgi:hypothetical protein
MRRTELVHLRVIEDFSVIDVRELFEKIATLGFDNDSGYGFINTNLEGTRVSSTLVLRKLTYRTTFDPESNTFSRQESMYFEKIPFFLDAEFDTVEVFSSATNTRRVISIVGKLLDYQFAIADPDISPVEFLNIVAASKLPFSLVKFCINNFIARPGISGRYSAEVIDNASGVNIIEKQQGDVEKVTLEVNFEAEERVELTVSRNGGLNITCDEDSVLDILDEIKKLMFGDSRDG